MLTDRHHLCVGWIVIVSVVGSCSASPTPAQNYSEGLFPQLLPWAGEHTSGQCARDSRILREATSRGTLWAARMFDSVGRVSGALEGQRIHLGSFEGCLSAGAVSPLGSRYCLVDMEAPKQVQVSGPPLHYSHIQELPPDTDVSVALAGLGVAPGFWCHGHVRVAVCAPLSCGPAQLEAGLRSQLQAQDRQLQVTIDPMSCTDSAEMQNPAPIAAKLFWCGLATLTVLTIASPYLGWHHWDWKRHMQALGAPAPTDLAPLAGIRCLSTMLIVITHRACIIIGVSLATTQAFRESTFSSFELAPIVQTPMYVNTFFFMSGILSVATATKRSTAHAIVLRLARLLPLLALLVLFYAVALPSMGSGPLWKKYMCQESEACKDYWWANLLFVNNYVRLPHGCLLQSWQLATDTQLFLLTLALQRYLQRYPLRLVSLLLVMAVLPPFLAALTLRLPAVTFMPPKYMQDVFADPDWFTVYTPTHMRAAPYVMGMGCAMLLHICKTCKLRLSRAATWLLQAAAVLALVAVMLACAAASDPSRPAPVLVSALLFSLSPVFWCIGMAALFVSLIFGEDTAIRSLLTWQPLVTLSRLSFGVFITSFTYQSMTTVSQRQGIHASVPLVVMVGVSDAAFTYFLSLWLHLIIEAPVLSVVTQMLQRKPAEGQMKMNGRVNTSARSPQKTTQKSKAS